jgi:hypothetical protein
VKQLLEVLAMMLLAAGLRGAAELPAEQSLAAPHAAVAAWAEEPPAIDGKLDEAVWSRARAYSLRLGLDRVATTAVGPREGGTVRFAYDEEKLYAAFEFADRDIAAEADADQLELHRFGDVAELFVGKAGEPWYWEIHVDPQGRSSLFFFPGPGRRLPSAYRRLPVRLEAAAAVDGTLNRWTDEDRGWTAEISLVWSELAALAGSETAGEWKVLAGRYNYGAQLDDVEISMFPQLAATRFHRPDWFASLSLEERGTENPANRACEEALHRSAPGGTLAGSCECIDAERAR